MEQHPDQHTRTRDLAKVPAIVIIAIVIFLIGTAIGLAIVFL